jgi:hypothetical protein
MKKLLWLPKRIFFVFIFVTAITSAPKEVSAQILTKYLYCKDDSHFSPFAIIKVLYENSFRQLSKEINVEEK